MKLNTGMNLSVDLDKMEFIYDVATTGPLTEKRRLDDIRASLSDPNAEGPSIVYAVAMDVAKKKHMQDLIDRNLLYGAMIFEKGVIGDCLLYTSAVMPCSGHSMQWNSLMKAGAV